MISPYTVTTIREATPRPAHHGAEVADAGAAQQTDVTYGPQTNMSEDRSSTPEHVAQNVQAVIEPSKSHDNDGTSIEVELAKPDTQNETALNVVGVHDDKSPIETPPASGSVSVVPSSHGDNVQYLGCIYRTTFALEF